IVSRHDEVRLGNLNPTRDLTYILDAVQGFLEIWKSKTLYGEIVNIGMNEEISVSDLAGMISGLLNKEIRILQDSDRVRPAQSEVDRLRCDNTKILANTNWKPRYNLEKGLKETIAWISENRALYKPEIYNV
ncbi:MAG: GDP-mannose 4,6-dehydratase, partial [Deltaproteobacteria bacterium]|nr:GDP-mannose 4,6-dehydratase [Deltaproteobacteria bacterium]